jgi:hypothetical protein
MMNMFGDLNLLTTDIAAVEVDGATLTANNATTISMDLITRLPNNFFSFGARGRLAVAIDIANGQDIA